jgi:hypothetical protein
MGSYRAYFLDKTYRFSDVEEFASGSDEEALEQAGVRFEKRKELAGGGSWKAASGSTARRNARRVVTEMLPSAAIMAGV